MDEDPPDSFPAGPRGLSEPLLRYLEARGVLLSLEAQEALQEILRVLLFAGVAALASFMGWVLLTAALVNFIVESTGWHWAKAVTILGAAHVVLAVLFVVVVRTRLGGLRLFADTLNEFKKDRSWLSRHTPKS